MADDRSVPFFRDDASHIVYGSDGQVFLKTDSLSVAQEVADRAPKDLGAKIGNVRDFRSDIGRHPTAFDTSPEYPWMGDLIIDKETQLGGRINPDYASRPKVDPYLKDPKFRNYIEGNFDDSERFYDAFHLDQELTENMKKPRVSDAAADAGRGLAVSSKVGALSPAEYNRAVELSNLIQDAQNKIDKLEMSPNQNAKIRQRIKNLKFQSYEAQRGFDRVIRAGDSTQQAMLRGLNSFSKQLPPLPREGVPFSYPDLPEATMTPLESPRVTTRRLLRGGLKALSTVVKVREAVLLGSDVGKHGLYEGTKESIGRLGGETGDLINVVGRGVSAVVPETPEFYAKAGVSPPSFLPVAREFGSLLSSVGSVIGKLHDFGPQDDLDREREREEERERVRNIPSNPSSPAGD